jgi:predicted RNase H-like nuclease (RuvC/YqgF family)
MKSERVKKIKKDIEICMKSLNCNGCSHHSQRSGECCRNLTNDILTYINELEKENDEQYKRIMELEQDLVHADEKVFYRECNVTLRENEIKQQAIKQFAERLKEKMSVREYMGVKYKQGVFSENDIDEALKEFEL